MLLFPTEILLEIARADDWLVSGTTARCSTELLREFTRADILKEILESIKASPKRQLLCWLTLSLPVAYFHTVPIIPESPWGSSKYGLLCTVPSQLFVSGGIICQQVYKQEWECDIDVYMTHNRISKSKIVCDDLDKLDLLHVSCEEVDRVIENFDISIVQQGFLANAYYMTALSLYTQHHKEIIIMPNEHNTQYRFLGKHDYKMHVRDIWHYIEIHDSGEPDYFMGHDNGPFHRCTTCRLPDQLVQWKKRIIKYIDRFPTFAVSYCRSPASSTNTCSRGITTF